MLRVWLIAMFLSVTGVASAASMDININNENMRMGFSWLADTARTRNLEKEVALVYNTDNVAALSYAFKVVGETGDKSNPLEAGVGGKFYFIEADPDFRTLAAALGFELRYYPKFINRLGIGGQVYYSPDVTTLTDASNIAEGMLQIEYQLIPQAFAYIGYRHLEATLLNSERVVLDEGAHIGIRMLLH